MARRHWQRYAARRILVRPHPVCRCARPGSCRSHVPCCDRHSLCGVSLCDPCCQLKRCLSGRQFDDALEARQKKLKPPPSERKRAAKPDKPESERKPKKEKAEKTPKKEKAEKTPKKEKSESSKKPKKEKDVEDPLVGMTFAKVRPSCCCHAVVAHPSIRRTRLSTPLYPRVSDSRVSDGPEHLPSLMSARSAQSLSIRLVALFRRLPCALGSSRSSRASPLVPRCRSLAPLAAHDLMI